MPLAINEISCIHQHHRDFFAGALRNLHLCFRNVLQLCKLYPPDAHGLSVTTQTFSPNMSGIYIINCQENPNQADDRITLFPFFCYWPLVKSIMIFGYAHNVTIRAPVKTGLLNASSCKERCKACPCFEALNTSTPSLKKEDL